MNAFDEVARIENAVPGALFLDVHVVGVEMDEDVVGGDTVDHVARLPAGVDEMVFMAVDRPDPEREADLLGMGGGDRQRLGDGAVFPFGRADAGPFADAVEGDARQRLGAAGLGLVESELEVVGRLFRMDRGPAFLWQTKRTDRPQAGFVEERAGMGEALRPCVKVRGPAGTALLYRRRRAPARKRAAQLARRAYEFPEQQASGNVLVTVEPELYPARRRATAQD